MQDYLDPINDLYQENILKFGMDSKSVGWKDLDSQVLRFNKLNQIFENTSQSFSLNDYGSGYGAHLTNILEAGLNITSYYAYDINSEMLNKLRENHKNVENCKITYRQSAELDTVSDYSVVSGTFNVMPDGDKQKWEENIKKRLLELRAHSRIGFAFNLLSTYVDWQSQDLFYADPMYWFDFCKREITSKVSLIHDYELYEWTMLCKSD